RQAGAPPDQTVAILSGYETDDLARAEDALRSSDDRFRRLVSLANVFPWEADAATLRLGYIDTRVVRLLGYPESEWRDASWTDHIHPEDRDAAVARIRDAIARAGEVEIEYRMVAAEGGTPWIRDIVSSEQGSDGARTLRGFRFDITERKRLEEQLYGAQKMEAVGRLAGGVAHDFNNLITAILGYTAFIQTELPEDDPLRDDVAEIGRAANRAANLTQQLLAFARRRVIQPRVVVLNELVRGLEKMMRRLSGENTELVTRVEPELWPVKVDPGQFEQVLVNLVVNARDAMPNGGRIVIETANTTLHDSPGQRPAIVTGPYVMIAVSDTGVGMDEQTKTRIFEPFFTTKRVGEGTGLGLATCYGIVKQASGYIWAFSEIGKGTTIRIYLPRADESPEPDAASESHIARTSGHETILLAEDQPQVRNLAQRALSARGYSVLSADNGERAVQLAEQHQGTIHLLLTDIVMPVMGGRDAADHILAARPGIRVLFMSGYSEHDVANPGTFADGGFIAKPFTPLELEHAVRAAIDGTEVERTGAL
ncbi:MAG: ATP-binding protein, partial [Longimicrobiales bacterium]